METTFMTIHNLSPEANILFASESILDVLGYHPQEVTGRSCFEYFHPDEVPFARYVHTRGVELDKAAVLHYARILGRNGQYVGCECVFTIVYDVLVACTSIYQQGIKSERRAIEAPTIRRLFASSPQDPRYHMLEHLSAKFRTPAPRVTSREPRAALILNRFTRTLTVMYATNAIADILGIEPEDIKDKSFYECIAEDCLDDAVRCLESAKANDSIAYLRFRFHDPRAREPQQATQEVDSSDSEDGGVELRNTPMDVDSVQESSTSDNNTTSGDDSAAIHSGSSNSLPRVPGRRSTRDSSDLDLGGTVLGQRSSPLVDGADGINGVNGVNDTNGAAHASSSEEPTAASRTVEVEAVVSCTSDGLVVILRKARPSIPAIASSSTSSSGVFAAPWGLNPTQASQGGYLPNLTSSYQPESVATGPPVDDFMNAIRDVAVFAWALTGINGKIATYAHGAPRGEAVPPGGYPVWDRQAGSSQYQPPENQAQQRWVQRNATQWQHPRTQYLHGMADGHGAGYYGSNYGYYPSQFQQQHFAPIYGYNGYPQHDQNYYQGYDNYDQQNLGSHGGHANNGTHANQGNYGNHGNYGNYDGYNGNGY